MTYIVGSLGSEALVVDQALFVCVAVIAFCKEWSFIAWKHFVNLNSLDCVKASLREKQGSPFFTEFPTFCIAGC